MISEPKPTVKLVYRRLELCKLIRHSLDMYTSGIREKVRFKGRGDGCGKVVDYEEEQKTRRAAHPGEMMIEYMYEFVVFL